MITIRQATVSDIPLLRRLADAAFPATYAAILTPAQIDYMMAWMYSEESLRRQFDEGQTFYIAREEAPEALSEAASPAGEHPLGYLSVERQGPSLFHLQKLYVLPEAQGRGIGAMLFRRAVEHVRTHGALPCRLELNVNRHNRALGFYEQMGMQRLRAVDDPIGNGFFMNDYIMGIAVE